MTESDGTGGMTVEEQWEDQVQGTEKVLWAFVRYMKAKGFDFAGRAKDDYGTYTVPDKFLKDMIRKYAEGFWAGGWKQ